MGKGSYLGGSTLVYAGKPWSSADHIDTPAVLWGRYKRALDELEKASLDDKRESYLPLVSVAVDHFEAARSVGFYISKSRDHEASEAAAECGLRILCEAYELSSGAVERILSFSERGPQLSRYASILTKINGRVHDDYLRDGTVLMWSDFTWSRIYDATREIKDIRKSDLISWHRELEIEDRHGFYMRTKVSPLDQNARRKLTDPSPTNPRKHSK